MKELSKKEWNEVWCKAYEVARKDADRSDKFFDHNGEQYKITDKGYAYQIWRMMNGAWNEIGAPVAYNPI